MILFIYFFVCVCVCVCMFVLRLFLNSCKLWFEVTLISQFLCDYFLALSEEMHLIYLLRKFCIVKRFSSSSSSLFSTA